MVSLGWRSTSRANTTLLLVAGDHLWVTMDLPLNDLLSMLDKGNSLISPPEEETEPEGEDQDTEQDE